VVYVDNPVIQAIRQNPKIIRQIIADPENHLGHHRMFHIERLAIDNIERQAFGKRRYAVESDRRHRYYRKFLSLEERTALRYEVKLLQHSFIRGVQLYQEVARLMSVKFKSHYDWRYIKDMLEVASEVIADIELNSYLNGKNIAQIVA
jgi:hypothetical protein